MVFNCAAYNAVDAAEGDPEAAAAVNARAPGLIAAACRREGARLVHYSTNYVFDGAGTDPAGESDAPAPLGVYARTKLEGELRVREALPGALVVRTAGVYGRVGSAAKGGSFPERIVRRARSGDPLRVVADQRLNPTYAAHLAARSLELAEAGAEGLVHLVAEGCCSWWEFAVAALEVAGVSASVESISSAELGSAAARPANGCLRSDREPPLPGWRQGLEEWWAGVASPS